MMMRILYFITACFLMVSGTLHAEESSPPGITFHVLRLIYPEAAAQGVTLTAGNTTPDAYLIQSRIRPVDEKTGDLDFNYQSHTAMPFDITPPLSRLEGNSELTVRIRRNDVSLPTDRESVFFVSMRAMPSQHPTPEQGKMVMTVVSNLKLFYRPEGLSKRAVADMAPRLRFHREGSQLIASNPTPYWLTFSRLAVGNALLSNAELRLMVPPFGQQAYAMPPDRRGEVTWQLIDEDGWNTPVSKQPL